MSLVYGVWMCASTSERVKRLLSSRVKVIFQQGLVSIPQLLMDHDLWAFKALALMVSPFSNAKNTTKVFPFIRIIG
jgi:hypothetical protein